MKKSQSRFFVIDAILGRVIAGPYDKSTDAIASMDVWSRQFPCSDFRVYSRSRLANDFRKYRGENTDITIVNEIEDRKSELQFIRQQTIANGGAWYALPYE